MTVSTTTAKVSYTGNGATTEFAVPFVFFGASEIEVIERTIATGAEVVQTLTTHYTVAGGDGSTGTVTAVTAPASTVEWHIRRKTARTQLTDYQPNDPFPAETHETALDRAAARDQEIEEKVGRALVFPRTDSALLDPTLPSSVDRAGLYLAFDVDGNPVPTAGTTSDIVVTAFAETLLDDTTAAAARSTLGVVAASESAAGIAELATQAETNAGTDDARIVTPLKLVTRPAQVLQRVGTVTGAVATGTTTIPFDDTIPQNTEGDEFLTQAITPKSATSILVIDVVFVAANSAAVHQIVALFQDSTAAALRAVSNYNDVGGGTRTIVLRHVMVSGTVSATTFKVRSGGHDVGTTTFNGSAGARLFGGVCGSSIHITEYAP